jgi:hypothetical protein
MFFVCNASFSELDSVSNIAYDLGQMTTNIEDAKLRLTSEQLIKPITEANAINSYN